MSRSKPSTRAKIALVVLPPLILLAVAELGTRAYLWMSYGKQVPTGNWTFEYVPYFVTKRSGNDYEHHPVREDQYRVLLLGGSTAAQIEGDLLREVVERYTDREVVVINLAEGGFILNQEKVMLMLRGIDAKPDLIVTLDGANDFAVSSKLHRTGEVYQAQLVSLAVENPFLNAIFAVARQSQLVNALAKFQERRAEQDAQADAALQESIIEHLIEGWEAIATVAKGMDVPYVMVLQPYVDLKPQRTDREEALAAGYDYRRKFMANLFDRTYERMSRHSFSGSPYVLDANTFFDEMAEVEVFLDEVHLTPAGEKRLLQEIFRAASSGGLKIPRLGEDPPGARAMPATPRPAKAPGR